MYEQIVLLLSFVFAIAMTHLLASATELILARGRVVFSGLQALWMLNALLGLMVNWLSVYGLSTLQHLTPGDVLINFGQAVIQYFTCSLLSMRVPEHGAVDMPANFEKQRRVIMAAFAALYAAAMAGNYFYPQPNGLPVSAWMQEDALILAGAVMLAAAAFARDAWLQWAAAIANFAMVAIFLARYTLAG
jgi:hypothetical protein